MKKGEKYKQGGSLRIRIPSLLFFFLACWLFLSGYYGDVLHMAQQYSFFSWNPEQMKFVTDNTPYGYLWWIGRALLQLYYYPVLGGAVVSLMLTAIAALTAYVFRISSRFRLLEYFIPFCWLAYSLYQGFDLYYLQETGKILGVPFCILLILIVQALFIRTFRKKSRLAAILSDSDCRPVRTWLHAGAVLLLFVSIGLFNEKARPYVRPTAYLQRCMWQQRWTDMITYVQEHDDVSCRPVAAYYAIALTQTGGINEHLFDIKYNYADLFLHNRSGKPDYGTAMYEADCNFYAGLMSPANRCAIEKMTMDGPSASVLKRLALIALQNGEHALCEKYLCILEQLPFESDFVAKYRAMNLDEGKLLADPELSRIKLLEPVNDNFEYNFRQPTFLGYNVAMLQGRSREALDLSIAACLYSKMMPDFLLRTQPLVGTTLTGSTADAVTMEASRNPNVARIFPIDGFALRHYQTFMREAARFSKDKERGQAELFERYKGYYPYYYYFGNLPSKSNQGKQQQQNKSGVN